MMLPEVAGKLGEKMQTANKGVGLFICLSYQINADNCNHWPKEGEGKGD